MSDTAAEVLALLLPAIIIAVTAWATLRFLQRRGMVATPPSGVRRIVMAALLTVGVIVGVWIGNRGDLSDRGAIVFGVMLWLVAMFTAFRRPKNS